MNLNEIMFDVKPCVVNKKETIKHEWDCVGLLGLYTPFENNTHESVGTVSFPKLKSFVSEINKFCNGKFDAGICHTNADLEIRITGEIGVDPFFVFKIVPKTELTEDERAEIVNMLA